MAVLASKRGRHRKVVPQNYGNDEERPSFNAVEIQQTVVFALQIRLDARSGEMSTSMNSAGARNGRQVRDRPFGVLPCVVGPR